MDALNAIFGSSTNPITAWQMTARAVLILIYGILLIRVAGRRMFSRASPADLVLTIVIGSNFSRTLTGNAPLFPTMVATTAMIAVYWLIVFGAFRFGPVRWLVKGPPVPLIENGQLNHRSLARLGFSHADILEALRQHGVSDSNEVETANLEADGQVSIVKRER